MSARAVDYIIVGQGLAGSCLALQLYARGCSVIVVDENHYQSSSMVAAGLYNPITGRKMVKTWKADLLFPYLKKFYHRWELELKAHFLHDLPIYRPFISVEEQNEWMGKSAKDEYAPYVRKVHMQSLKSEINDPYGGIELAQTGYVDVPLFLSAVRNFLHSKDMLVEQSLSNEEIEFSDKRVVWKNIKASKLIFCEGVAASENSYFNWLPFKPVKGEILTVRLEQTYDMIVNRGIFVLPGADDTYRVGSNYNNHDLSWLPTDGGKVEIETKLKQLISCNYSVIDQVAGVRPASNDRKPIIGLHPCLETIGIFNGLGTKGVSLAPYFSDRLAEFLMEQTELDREVNINRHFSLYSNPQ